MSFATLGVSSNLNNHELEKFVEQTTELLKLSVVQALNSSANPAVYKVRPGNISLRQSKGQPLSVASVGRLVADRFERLDPQMRHVVMLDLGRNRDVTRQLRSMAVDMRSEKAVLEQIDMAKQFRFMDKEMFSTENLQATISGFDLAADNPSAGVEDTHRLVERITGLERLKKVFPVRELGQLATELAASEPSPSGAITVNRGVEFRVHQVKCLDETDPDWAGSDEISWGGVANDTQGSTIKLMEHFIGSGFDSGDRKNFTPPKLVHTFSLNQTNYPHTCMVTLALAEKDSGGMSAFIQQLYEAVKAHLDVILMGLGAAAGAALGAWAGGSIGTLGGPLGTVIGIAAGAIVGALVAFLADLFKDDIFAPEAASVTFSRPGEIFEGGSLVSPLLHLNFRDHGGHYRIFYDWKVSR